MLATTLTAAILGIEARLIHVEADVAGGFPVSSWWACRTPR